MNKSIHILTIAGLLIVMSGCAARGPVLDLGKRRTPSGAYYEVQRGDTLWKISKLHDVEVKDLVKANRLPDATKISVGQKLFIPSSKVASDYPRTARVRNATAMFSWPVAGRVISYFGNKKGLVTNKGIDIEAREGSNVAAADNGVVSFVDENMKGLGKTIIIDHENGFSTLNTHNSKILTKAGEHVKRNQVIAKVGKTGRATRPYLHFQIRKGHEPQNPFYYLP